MSHPLRRLAALSGLVIASIFPLVTAPSASATTPQALVPSVLTNTDGYLTSVRTYFLCSTAACKKDRTALLKTAESAMTKLAAQQVSAGTAIVASKYRPVISVFVTDLKNLESSFREYFITTSTVTLSGLVGNIFYLTSDVGSDGNVLRAESKNSTVTFDLWAEGEAATLVAMQTDSSALQSSTATTSIAIYANQLLEAESTEMILHATGPNSSFNTLLTTFAHNQLLISRSDILELQHKKAPLTTTQVANLNKSVTAEFAELIKTETALVKK